MRLVRAHVETDIDKLHVVSNEVDLSDLVLIKNIENALEDTFEKLDGKLQGVSAIQVGFPYRVALLRYVKGQPYEIIYNPVVKLSIGKKRSNEGCLSEGPQRYIVNRPVLVYVEYSTKYRERRKVWLPYKKARIFMHEYDHMNGVLLQDIGEKAEQ